MGEHDLVLLLEIRAFGSAAAVACVQRVRGDHHAFAHGLGPPEPPGPSRLTGRRSACRRGARRCVRGCRRCSGLRRSHGSGRLGDGAGAGGAAGAEMSGHAAGCLTQAARGRAAKTDGGVEGRGCRT